MPKFHDAKGRLTAYALACGYIEIKQRGTTNVTLWSEHGVFHVRAHDHGGGGRLFWESFARLAPARSLFAAARV